MIRLTADEAWNVIADAHTGILTTLRRDGTPIALPVWFVAEDRTIVIMTPAGTKEISRVTHDPRASFLVESGKRWAELLPALRAGGQDPDVGQRAHRDRASLTLTVPNRLR